MHDALRFMAPAIGVVPSRGSGGSRAALEWMSLGPFGNHHVGGLPEIIEDGVTGILVPPCRPDLLAEALRHLLENPDLAEDAGRWPVNAFNRFTLSSSPSALKRRIRVLSA